MPNRLKESSADIKARIQAEPPLDRLTVFYEERQETLVDLSIEIAKTNGYAPFTTTIRAAWVGAIQSLTESIGAFMISSKGLPAGALAVHNYGKDPRFKTMRKIARQHRSLGITLQMYLGLLKHFRNIYLELLDDFEVKPEELKRARIGVRDFFDETELSVTTDWKESKASQRLRELQARTRSLSLEKDRYFAIFESLRNPAFLLDRNNILVNANQAAAELFLGDTDGGGINFLKSMRRKTSALTKILQEILKFQTGSDEAVWLETVSGRRYFDVRMRALHDAVGNIALGHVLQLNDVTAHKLAVDKAQRGEKQMSRFLATMSHEIRTPLHSVLGATDLLRTSDRQDHANYLDVIESAGQTLLQTLNNVLDYSKFENSRPVPRPEPTDVVKAMRVFQRLASIQGNDKNTRVVVDISDRFAPSITLDWAMTRQVLTNLLTNAIRFDQGDGVRICVSLKNPSPEGRQSPERGQSSGGEHSPGGTQADETAKAEGTFIRFEVHDCGPGITEEDARALFQPFNQIRARNTDSGGAGLGLAISHHLVEAMKGRIGYKNQVDGTIVWFELPCNIVNDDTNDRINHTANNATSLTARHIPGENAAGACEGKTPSAKPSSLLPATGMKCLLVDDDPAGGLVTSRQLERLGYSVEIAQTVSQAETLSGAGSYDAFVIDYLLPDGTGPALARILKSDPEQKARLVALTANVEVIIESNELADLFDAILAKPVDQDTLGEALCRINLRELKLSGYDFSDASLPASRRLPNARLPAGKLKPYPLQEMAPPTMRAMIVTFEQQWTEFRVLLNRTSGESSCEELGFFAHRLAGTTAILGLYDLETPLKQLETRCDNAQNARMCMKLVAQLDRDLSDFSSWATIKSTLDVQ